MPTLATSVRTGRDPTPQRKEPARSQLTLAEHTCLTLVTQGVNHGWAIGSLLAPDGEVGRVWSLTRPLTYRAIDALVERRLVTRRRATPRQGRERSLLSPTAAGRREASRWLDAPVDHLRDVRTEFLVKIALHQRDGRDIEQLLAAQKAVFSPTIDRLTTTHSDDDLVDLWRRESARAVRRFLDYALHPDRVPRPTKEKPDMRLSARNQLRAMVSEVTHGEVMSSIKMTLPDGQALTAAITKEAAEDLDFAPGDDVVVIIKSTEVIVAKDA